MSFRLSQRSLQKLDGVHPDLVAVVKRAIEISQVDFVVIQGLRTPKQQAENVRKGVSWTTKSRHLTGHAVDVAPWAEGKIDWKDLEKFALIRDAFFQAGHELDIPLRWGGDWNGNGDYHDEIKRGSYDGGHFELPRRLYPEVDTATRVKAVATSKRVGFAGVGVVATMGAATDTLNQVGEFKSTLVRLFGDSRVWRWLSDVPVWVWFAIITVALVGVIWTKWHDTRSGHD